MTAPSINSTEWPVQSLSQEQVDQFHRDGFLILPQFVPTDVVTALKQEIRNIVKQDFDPRSQEYLSIFDTERNAETKSQSQGDTYFMDSGDKIRFFVEKDAVVKDATTGKAHLKEEFIENPLMGLNKIGHDLHTKSPLFRAMSHALPFKTVYEQLRPASKDTRIAQSMYIFKHPKGMGGVVTPHQDATFLYANNDSCIGYWIAMDDAEVDNGCLWGWPGSHTYGLAQRMIRKDDGKSNLTEFVNYEVAPDFDFWNDAKHAHKYVPWPVPAGGVVLIHGQCVHKSSRNTSDRHREAYTLHLFDRENEDSFSRLNWLHRDDGFPAFWPSPSV